MPSDESLWLFTRGRESIRVVRTILSQQTLRLIVSGPGYVRDVREFLDEAACTVYHSMFERRLLAVGFHLENFSERRNAPDRRRTARGPERRR
jgi:hypothetical protein